MLCKVLPPEGKAVAFDDVGGGADGDAYEEGEDPVEERFPNDVENQGFIWKGVGEGEMIDDDEHFGNDEGSEEDSCIAKRGDAERAKEKALDDIDQGKREIEEQKCRENSKKLPF